MADELALDAGRLRLLYLVARHGSIAGAARAVGLTASAVSQQLAQLERETGAELVERSNRGVRLTGAGHALAQRAGQLLDLLRAARADVDRLAGATGGPVAVAAVASAAATFVSSAVCGLRRTQPDITVSVRSAEPDRALGMLLAGEIDLAVVDEYDYVPLAMPEAAVVTELAAEPLLLISPIDGSDAAGAVDGDVRVPTGVYAPESVAAVGLTAFAETGWVMPPDEAACGRAVRAACRSAGFEPRVRWQSDDLLLLVRAVADGHGVAVLPRLSISSVLGPGSASGPAGFEAAGDAGFVAAGDAVRLRSRLLVRPLRGPRLGRRLLAVAPSGTADRPVVTTLVRELARAVTAGAV